MPAPVPRPNPYAGFNFLVQINVEGGDNTGKQAKGSFSEVSGLEAAQEPIEYRNGSDDITPRKQPGQKKFANIVLKRGVTADVDFWKWILKGLNGAQKPIDGSITLLDEAKNPVLTYLFRNGWPCKFTGPGLNAKNNEIAVETVEICHEGLSIDTIG